MRFTKETARRALRTFVQAMIGYIIVNIGVINITDEKEILKSSVVGLLMSAIASGISAVMNFEVVSEDDNYDI